MSDQKIHQEDLNQEQKEALASIRMSRVILPVVLGVLVILYLLWKQFDPEEFSKITWSGHTSIWIGISIVLLVVRHLAYATRLKILSEGAFNWFKCIELIFIWEFSSAVSPTSVGGSAVALFALSQEKIGAAKTAAIVLYTVVMDTFFFIGTLPFLYVIIGPDIIRPGLSESAEYDRWFYLFAGAYIFMALYGAFFAYGLLVQPNHLKKLIVSFTHIPFLKKYRAKLEKTGNDFVIASKEIRKRKWPFHIGVFLSTATAWSLRFLLLNALIIAIVPSTSMLFMDQFELYARLESMFVIMAFSPTPGGAGFAEFVFGGFLSDYVPEGISLIVAFIWRFLAYYSYLIAGVIIIPNWIRKIVNRKRTRRVVTNVEKAG